MHPHPSSAGGRRDSRPTSSDKAPRQSPPASDVSIGVSACLLGEKTRYDGGHKLDAFIRDTLGSQLRLVAVCPEVEIGLGVPRETLQLVHAGSGKTPRLIASTSGADLTNKMAAHARTRCRALVRENLCGFILKSNSPSCGLERVRVYGRPGKAPARNGRGIFALELLRRLPRLPVEQEDRLHDAERCENFFTRVFAYRRLRGLFSGRWRLGDLVAFHAREKYLLLAHDPVVYRRLGRLVATAQGRQRRTLAGEYQELFMTGLRRRATRGKHVNVLQHIAGYFTKVLTGAERRQIQEAIAAYQAGELPLAVPLELLKRQVQCQAVEYLRQQTYLELGGTYLR